MPLHRQASDPLYLQLKETLSQEIRAGQYRPHDRLPSERALSERYNLSRMTVRQALQEMAHEGIIYTRVGKGTFVAAPTHEHKLDRLTGFTEEMDQKNIRAGARVLRLVMIPAPGPVAHGLGLEPDQSVVFLQRIRLSNEEPIAIERSYLHFHHHSALLKVDFERVSLYKTLNAHFDIIPARAEQRIGADLCTQQEQSMLHMEPGMPVLRNRRITYDQWNQPFEYVESAYRADRYAFVVELTI